MAKSIIKTAQPMVGSYYFYGEVRYFAGLCLHARKTATP